jgi:prevent-host-death family protein
MEVAMKYSEAIKPISYFKSHLAQVVRQLNEEQGTMIITQNGEAKAAIIDIKQYEQLQETMAMLELIAQGRQDLDRGRYRPAKDVFKDLKASISESDA